MCIVFPAIRFNGSRYRTCRRSRARRSRSQAVCAALESPGRSPSAAGDLHHGQQLNPDAERHYFELRREGKPARYWELFHDRNLDVVSTPDRQVGTVGAVDTRRYRDPARGARKAAKLIAAKLQEGYRESPPRPTGRAAAR